MQTVEDLARFGARLLASGDSSARADAQIILARVLGRRREWLIAHGEHCPERSEISTFTALCERRAEGMPVPYITGWAGFYGREFVVNENVLVPRPETEHLVADAVAHLGNRPAAVRVLDVGTGSGAIACSLAAELPAAFVEATDTSRTALDVAEENARRLGVEARCRFTCADIVPAGECGSFDAILANLPYIPTASIPRRPDPVAFEPLCAVDGGLDGLDVYRKLLAIAPKLLRRRGIVLLEAAPPTIDALASLSADAFPRAVVLVREDYAGQKRYVCVNLPSGTGLRTTLPE